VDDDDELLAALDGETVKAVETALQDIEGIKKQAGILFDVACTMEAMQFHTLECTEVKARMTWLKKRVKGDADLEPDPDSDDGDDYVRRLDTAKQEMKRAKKMVKDAEAAYEKAREAAAALGGAEDV